MEENKSFKNVTMANLQEGLSVLEYYAMASKYESERNRKIAERNHKMAEEDHKMAFECYKKSADSGRALAKCQFAGRDEIGRDSFKEEIKYMAESYYSFAANDELESYNCGYENGSMVVQKKLQACANYARSAYHWCVYAKSQLAGCYETGRDGVEKNIKQAAEFYYDIAVNAEKTADDIRYRGEMSNVQRYCKEAVKYYKKSADLGNANAEKALDRMFVKILENYPNIVVIVVLAFLLESGAKYVEKQENIESKEEESKKKRRKCLINAAWQLVHVRDEKLILIMTCFIVSTTNYGLNVPSEIFRLILMMVKQISAPGILVKDYDSFTKESNADGGALEKVGWLYENGLGVEKNINMAIKYYQLAAKKGGVEAQRLYRFQQAGSLEKMPNGLWKAGKISFNDSGKFTVDSIELVRDSDFGNSENSKDISELSIDESSDSNLYGDALDINAESNEASQDLNPDFEFKELKIEFDPEKGCVDISNKQPKQENKFDLTAPQVLFKTPKSPEGKNTNETSNDLAPAPTNSSSITNMELPDIEKVNLLKQKIQTAIDESDNRMSMGGKK